MTKTEARETYILLCHVLGQPTGAGAVPGDARARDASTYLADRAHAAMWAGLTGENVRGAWPEKVTS